MIKRAFEVKELRLDKLRSNAWNPPERRSRGRAQRKSQSLQDHGLIEPPVVTPDGKDTYTILNGDTRVAGAKLLGETTLPCSVIRDAEAAAIYREANFEVTKLNGNEAIKVWLVEPNAVPLLVRKALERAEEIVGRVLIKRMASGGLSLSAYGQACYIAECCGQDDAEGIMMALKWILAFRNGPKVKKALQDGLRPDKLWACVSRGKNIALKLYGVEKE